MKLFTTPKASAIEVPRLLLNELGVKVSEASLTEKLENHPDFPSLMAVSDCFNGWHLPNAGYLIKKENYKVEELKFPFIAQLPANGGIFILVHQITKGKVIYSDEKVKRKEITEHEFLDTWSGILLYAKATEKSGEEGYFTKQLIGIANALIVPCFILIVMLATALFINFSAAPLAFSLLLAIKFIGVGISVLLLAHGVNANNPLVQNLCSLGKKNNCNAILKSDAAKATSWLSWSEVGFFYFAGSLLSLIFVPSSLYFLVWFNILALPYTLWSIYYQYSHKSWCVLCCAVQIILWLEFAIALVFGLLPFSFSSFSLQLLPSAFYLLLSFIAPVLLWYILKPVLQKSSEYRLLKQQLNKFKYNAELFGHALTKQPRYAVPNEIAPITLGNPEAQTIITMVSNPFCGPCAKAHETLDKWLKTRSDIQLEIVFTTADHDDDQRTKVARHVTALSLTNDVALVEKALNHWYELREKKYENWAKDFQIEIGEEVNVATKKQKQWCKMAEITFTPTILVNGYKLPEPYQLDDLPYLIN
ncbi:cysteine peptidase family C39 domain-containing protein [Pedobacter sp. SL55]|uniref:cysteine peptidase family C39 domain-containing protein n=1 Tax=Pedobacter sp. SL55 TaxID=2995161 RepID=UPI002271D176|nr:cysteine peptidase family C39 domain-containing protein [Pedobacter sp. SL55]WAC41404.1 cysteine peptidase family C39 domain-containing protein [Pedobacter sp. SL55]